MIYYHYMDRAGGTLAKEVKNRVGEETPPPGWNKCRVIIFEESETGITGRCALYQWGRLGLRMSTIRRIKFGKRYHMKEIV